MAGIYNFTIEQYVPFTTVFQWTDANNVAINISGLTPIMQIRIEQSTTATLIADLSSYCTVDGPNGKVTLSIPASKTSTLNFDTAHYSLRLSGSSRLLQGIVRLSAETSA